MKRKKEARYDLEVVAGLIPEFPAESRTIEDIEMAEMIMVVLKTLTPREARILKMRFGLMSESYKKEHTLEEVAKHEGLSRQRISQIELRALRRLRHPSRLNILLGNK